MEVSFGFIQLGFGLETYGKFGNRTIIFLPLSLEKVVKQNPKRRASNHYGNVNTIFEDGDVKNRKGRTWQDFFLARKKPCLPDKDILENREELYKVIKSRGD
jgi:hypothetical protein